MAGGTPSTSRGVLMTDDQGALAAVASSRSTREDPNGNVGRAQILATKLFIPQVRPDLVPRPRLLARLDAGLHGPLTVVAAPAGWGKTTVVAAWCATADRDRPVAWVSLDAGDNDPVRFWSYVLTALDQAQSGVAEDALRLLRLSQPPAIEGALTLLLNALAVPAPQEREVPAEVGLVLDDYHLITAAAVHAGVAFLLDHLPPRCHLVLVTREDPPLPLARRRAQGTITELRAADLRFTPEETAAFLTAALGIPFSDDVVRTLEVRSEGWIAGLQLAALSLQGRTSAQAGAFIAAFAGSHRYIVDYLIEEVLARQAPAVQTFLLRTAVLDRFCAPLCQRLLEEEPPAGREAVGRRELDSTSTGQHADLALFQRPPKAPAAQALLERVEQANLFLIPLDDERRWYRYHHLFAEVLRTRLRQLDPAMPAALLRRASVWCEEEGLIEEAVPYALAAADFARAATLIEQHSSMTALREGRFQTALGWLKALPEPLVQARWRLSILYAAALMYNGHVDAAEAHLRVAESAVASIAFTEADQGSDVQDDGPEAEHTVRRAQGHIALVRANLALVRGDVVRALPLVRQALELLPLSDPELGASTLITASSTYRLSGNVTQTIEQQAMAGLALASAFDERAFLVVNGVTNLAQIYTLQGRLRLAAATLREISKPPPPLSLAVVPGNQAYHIDLGEVLREWNDLDAAEHHLTEAVASIGSPTIVGADIVTRGYLELARVRQARGEHGAALETLGMFEQMARQRGFVPDLIERGAAVRAEIELAAGNLATALRWLDASRLTAEAGELPFRRERAYLTLVRVRIAQGRNEPGGPHLAEALRLLERLQREAEANGRGRSVLEILLLRALARHTRRGVRGALGTLTQALKFAQPEGYVRLFADEGAPMAALLTELLEVAGQRRVVLPAAIPDYAHFLLGACRAQDGGAAVGGMPLLDSARSPTPAEGVPPLLDPLTERELEVLRLLAAGASNAAIAAALVVTVGTVKKHVFNVCAKLGAQNRTQAVARARALHLL